MTLMPFIGIKKNKLRSDSVKLSPMFSYKNFLNFCLLSIQISLSNLVSLEKY